MKVNPMKKYVENSLDEMNMSNREWEVLVSSTFKNQRNGKNGSRYDPTHYSFYAIVNSSICMDKGSCASAVARSFKIIHNALEDDKIKREYLDRWEETGEKFIVLEGSNEKHLRYLNQQLRHIAVATHSLTTSYGKGLVTLVLTVFGRQDCMNAWLGKLPLLK